MVLFYVSCTIQTDYKQNQKDVTPPHELSKGIYVYKCHCGTDYICRISQRFHIRRDQEVTKKLKKFIFDDESGSKAEQSSIHKHLVNNSKCTKNYNDRKFKFL